MTVRPTMASDLSAASLFDLTGRTALVTGASRGIAAAIASVLARNGAKVCINYSAEADRRVGFPDAAAQLRDSLVKAGCEVSLLDVDLAGADAPALLMDGLEPGFRQIDIAVLSASLQIHSSFLQLSREDIERQIGLNLVNTVLVLQKILPGMVERQYGRILTVGSVQEMVPSPEMPIYSATKAAQANLVQNLAAQFAPQGIAINNLAPGLIETDRNQFKRNLADVWAENARLANPMQRAGLPMDLVGAALLLCSDAAAFITGATLNVTGGGHIPVPLFDAKQQRSPRA